MPIKDDLENEVKAIFRDAWTTRDGTVVPSEDSLGLGNDAVKLKATVLYADLSDSTKLVDTKKDWFAAEVYKAFLRCAARIISVEGGTITAYDGDRVMAVFIGDSKNTTAVRVGLKINYACKQIIQPAIRVQYPNTDYTLQHTVGIDTSNLFVARAGIRGANDLVWIGRAANHAAKLCTLDHDYPTRITDDVYKAMMGSSKFSNGVDMWEPRSWTAMGDARIYRSTYWWAL